MPATPRRKINNEEAQSPAQSLLGRSVAIPSDIFKESDSQYTGKVVGTPRRKNAVYVKVDQDDTEYWFPADEVAKWVVKDPKPAATPSTPKTPRRRKTALHQDSPNGASTAASSQPTKQGKRPKQQAAFVHTQPTAVNTQQQHVHDAASCHPERPEDFTETIEGLVATSAEEVQAVTASPSSLRRYCVIALLVVLFALVAIQGESMSDWLIQQFKH